MISTTNVEPILVIGPPGSGKSALVATLHKALIEGLTGFEQEWHLVPVSNKNGSKAEQKTTAKNDTGSDTEPDADEKTKTEAEQFLFPDPGFLALEHRFLQFLKSAQGIDKADHATLKPAKHAGIAQADVMVRIGLAPGPPPALKKPKWFSRRQKPLPPAKILEIWEPGDNARLTAAMHSLFSTNETPGAQSHDGTPHTPKDTSPGETSHERENPSTVPSLSTLLSRANHLIFCKPIDGRGPQNWDVAFVDLCGRIASGEFGTFQHIVIAFSFYETMFLDGHDDALFDALTPFYALRYMQAAVLQHEAFRNGLTRLANLANTRVFCQPVSSFGFLPHTGRANLDPWLNWKALHFSKSAKAPPNDLKNLWRAVALHPQLIADPSEEAARVQATWPDDDITALTALEQHYRASWWPFLTADPFITCATGQAGALTVSLKSLLASCQISTPR